MAFQPLRTTILTDVARIGVAKVRFEKDPLKTEMGRVCTGNGLNVPTSCNTASLLKYCTKISVGRRQTENVVVREMGKGGDKERNNTRAQTRERERERGRATSKHVHARQ